MAESGMLQTMLGHASCREYAEGSVEAADWDLILKAAQQAPTDATGQLYSLIDVVEPGLRAEVGRLAGDQDHVHRAAKLLVVCLDVRRVRLLLESRGERLGIKPRVSVLFGVTDATLFAQNLALAAQSLGYGTCYLGGVQNHSRAIAHALRLPQGVVPLWGLTMGRPAAPGRPKPRLPRPLVVHTDGYRDPTAEELQQAYLAMAAATRSGDWLNPIRKYFGAGGIMEHREAEWSALLREQGLDLGESPR